MVVFTPLPPVDRPAWWLRDGERVPVVVRAWVEMGNGWHGRVVLVDREDTLFGDRWVPAVELQLRE